MYNDMKVAAVLPAYNEEAYVAGAVAKLPRDVFDDVIVVDDASTDATRARATEAGADLVITHDENGGVGAALITGFRASLDRGNDVAVVIPGDGQADLTALPRLLDKVEEGYGLVMTDRLSGRDPTEWGMPRYRIFGSRVLSWMTWLATGIRVVDPQSGYKAVTSDTLRTIPLQDVVKRWGVHNDMLSYCAIHRIPVTAVSALPVYRDEGGSRITSHIKLWDLIPRHLALFARMLRRRIASFYQRSSRWGAHRS